MNRNRRNSRSDIIIDLTSLLDVIFIILLVVLCSQQASASEQEDSYSGRLKVLEQAEKEADKAKKDAETARDVYNDAADTNTGLGKYVFAVSIAVPYDDADVTKREIKLLREGEGEIETYELRGYDTAGAMEEFTSDLERYITKYEDSPVIISLNDDDERILYRDETEISSILFELSGRYDNVYVKGNLGDDR